MKTLYECYSRERLIGQKSTSAGWCHQYSSLFDLSRKTNYKPQNVVLMFRWLDSTVLMTSPNRSITSSTWTVRLQRAGVTTTTRRTLTICTTCTPTWPSSTTCAGNWYNQYTHAMWSNGLWITCLSVWAGGGASTLSCCDLTAGRGGLSITWCLDSCCQKTSPTDCCSGRYVDAREGIRTVSKESFV